MIRFSRTRRVAAASLVLVTAAGCDSTDIAPAPTASVTASVTASGSAAAAAEVATDSASAVLSAALAFLSLLDDGQRTTVRADRSAANLSHWSNLPDQLFPRAGLRMDRLSVTQQAAVLAILKAGLSSAGYEQVVG